MLVKQKRHLLARYPFWKPGKRLWEEDIQGSIAYAKGLSKIGTINDDEFSLMLSGLEKVADEWRSVKGQIDTFWSGNRCLSKFDGFQTPG